MLDCVSPGSRISHMNLLISTYVFIIQIYHSDGGSGPREIGVKGKPLEEEDERGRPIGGTNMPPPKDPPNVLTLVEEFNKLSRDIIRLRYMDGLPPGSEEEFQRMIREREEHEELLRDKCGDLYVVTHDIKHKVHDMERKLQELEPIIENLKKSGQHEKNEL